MDHDSSCAHSSSFIFFAPFNHVRLEALACAPRTCCGLSRRQFRGEDRDLMETQFCNGFGDCRGPKAPMNHQSMWVTTIPRRRLRFERPRWRLFLVTSRISALGIAAKTLCKFPNHASCIADLKNIFTKHCRVRISHVVP